MHLEIVGVGSELTSGDIVDTNSAFIAAAAENLGLIVRRVSIVGDFMDDIVSAVRDAFQRGREHLARGIAPQAVIITGGLGPTGDDITREAVAKAFDRGLCFHQPSLDHVAARLRLYGAPLGENNKRQAYFPEGSEVIPNKNGTAPAFVLEEDGVPVFVLPGVPMEMKALFLEEVIPRLKKRLPGGAFVRKTFLTYGKGESAVDRELGEFMERGRNPLFGTLIADGIVQVRMVAHGATEAEARALADEYTPKVRERLKDCIIGEDEISPAAILVSKAKQLGRRIAVGESCTGGLVGVAITSIPGSSAVFLGSIVAYDNSVKTSVLGVPPSTIEKYGAVSIECAEAMADGVRRVTGADLAASVTGIAGPDGGTPDKPVGTVCFGIATGKGTSAERRQMRGDRDMVRARSVSHALVLLLRNLEKPQ